MSHQPDRTIVVKYSSDVVGDGVLWEGSPEAINQIPNLPARHAAQRLIETGAPQHIGMWEVAYAKPREVAA